jgi:hypothetical protein
VKPHSERLKAQNFFRRYIKTGNSDSTSTSTQKNSKRSAPQRKRVFREKEKTREKDPYPFIGNFWLDRCMRIGACNGRWRPSSIVQATPGLLSQIAQLQFNSLARSALLG